MSAVIEQSGKKTLTERFRGKVVKDFSGYSIDDLTDPQNVRRVLQKIDINFEDGTKLTVSAEKVDITIKIQAIDLSSEELIAITDAKLVCE